MTPRRAARVSRLVLRNRLTDAYQEVQRMQV
jgi:flagellar hook-basal body complex protein FliE